MKRMFMSFVAFFVMVLAIPVFSQSGSYTVQPGDTLWSLSGEYLNDPMKWGELVGANPFLKEAGRQFQLPNGQIVVLIRPGETLNDLRLKAKGFRPVPPEDG